MWSGARTGRSEKLSSPVPVVAAGLSASCTWAMRAKCFCSVLAISPSGALRGRCRARRRCRHRLRQMDSAVRIRFRWDVERVDGGSIRQAQVRREGSHGEAQVADEGTAQREPASTSRRHTRQAVELRHGPWRRRWPMDAPVRNSSTPGRVAGDAALAGVSRRRAGCAARSGPVASRRSMISSTVWA